MSTSPYMGLDLPTPEVTTGPAWAELLNALLLLIDAHDHTTDKGTKVTQDGISVTDTFSMASQLVDAIKGLLLESQTSLATPGAVYRVGNNLWYNNAAGVAIQLTTGTSVNASGTGTISLDTPSSYPYTVVSGDAQKVLAVDTTSAKTLNLPAATTSMFFMIKDISGQAQTNNISVVPDTTDTIDGVNAAFLMNTNSGSIGLISDGVSAWYVV